MLAIGAVFAGFLLEGDFIGSGWHGFWDGAIFNAPDNDILEAAEHVPFLISLLPTLMGLLGIALAYVMYMAVPTLPARLADAFPAGYRFLLNKWYFDELYNFLFVRPAQVLARVLWQVGDATIIDGVPNGIAALTTDSSRRWCGSRPGRSPSTPSPC